MSVFAPVLGALWRQLEGYGIDPDPLFRQEGIDPEALFDAGARIGATQSQRLFHRAARASGDPLFGLKSADTFRPAHLGALGFAWLASSSLRVALQRLSRYARVIQEKLTINLEEDAEFFHVRIDPHLPAEDEAMREDMQTAALLGFCRVLAGAGLNPARVCFTQPQPRDTGPHYALFRCPLAFDCAVTALVLHIRDVDRRLTGSNDELARLNEHIVVKYLAHSAKADIVNRAKAAILEGLANGAVTEATIAQTLNTTSRNLHRHLGRAGTSFKRVLTEVRRELAEQYIQDRSKSLTEISYLLGFSEVSSFSRAFKGWTGQAPSAARAR
jgi:AraC-like DNA-binding protein